MFSLSLFSSEKQGGKNRYLINRLRAQVNPLAHLNSLIPHFHFYVITFTFCLALDKQGGRSRYLINGQRAQVKYLAQLSFSIIIIIIFNVITVLVIGITNVITVIIIGIATILT